MELDAKREAQLKAYIDELAQNKRPDLAREARSKGATRRAGEATSTPATSR
jgi:hypothetical protein